MVHPVLTSGEAKFSLGCFCPKTVSPTEILEDLSIDSELADTMANLEATYFQPLEDHGTLDPITCFRLGRARDALAMAADALKRLADCREHTD